MGGRTPSGQGTGRGWAHSPGLQPHGYINPTVLLQRGAHTRPQPKCQSLSGLVGYVFVARSGEKTNSESLLAFLYEVLYVQCNLEANQLFRLIQSSNAHQPGAPSCGYGKKYSLAWTDCKAMIGAYTKLELSWTLSIQLSRLKLPKAQFSRSYCRPVPIFGCRHMEGTV